MNLIIDTDSYKSSHYLQYPPGTLNLFNYLESRGGTYKETVFFGLQYLLKEYLTHRVTMEEVYEAATFFKAHGLPFNLAGWSSIAHDLDGKIPLRIKAVDEGSVIPTLMPLLSCEATNPDFAWVVGWFETMIMRLWYPITVATVSYGVKQVVKRFMLETCDTLDGLPFKLHDFGSRGVSSRESAAIGGASHLVNFMGSDTVAGVVMANKYYNAGMAGFSIPAAEHSTVTSWGREHEVDAFRNMLRQFGQPGKIVAVVSDSYNIYEAVDKLWGGVLRQEVIDSGATVVIRPDSGDPVMVVNILLHRLDEKFGSVLNTKGYKVLNHVRLIQGDGVSPYTIERMLQSAKQAGFSAENLAFGMGGNLLQNVNRDTQRFAYKCSAIQKAITWDGARGTQWLDVYKDPVDDAGKKSKAGRIGTKLVNGTYEVCPDDDKDNLLQVRFENGELVGETTFEEVRSRAK